MPSRAFPVVAGSGRTTVSGTPIQRKTKESGYENLILSTNSPTTDNAFLVERHLCSGSTVTVSGPAGSFAANWPSNLYDQRLYLPTAPAVNYSIMRSRLLANSNPYRADVQLPVFIFELGEIPGMIRYMGDILLKGRRAVPRHPISVSRRIAADNLAIQFGWLPLIGDINRLLSFQASFQKRQKEWERLYNGSGLKRRMTLDVYSANASRPFSCTGVVNGAGTMQATGTFTQTVWGTVRWKPIALPAEHPLRRPSDREIRRDMLGLGVRHMTANLWEALPWSWLVDWFTNFGDLLTASMGRSSIEAGSVNIMTHKQLLLGHGPLPATLNSGVPAVISTGSILGETKQRGIYNTSHFSMHNPLLSGRQLSILASLTALRTTNRR